MTGSGGGRSANSSEAGFATSGKLVVTIDNLRVNSGTERAILMRNKGPNVVKFKQLERLESELVDFLTDGIVSIDLDLIYTPDLTPTTEIPLPEARGFRIRDNGVAENIDPSLFDIVELTGFVKGAAGNKKIELADNGLAFFSTAQSTTVAQSSDKKTFKIPYAIGPGEEIVFFITNELKIGALNVDVDLVLSGYSTPPTA